MSEHMNFCDRINGIIKFSGDDDQLFARYGYKLFNIAEEDDANLILKDLQERKPNFLNDFQEIYILGFLEHVTGEKNDIPWDTGKKLKENWYYMAEFGDRYKDPSKYPNHYKSLNNRGIYV